MGDWTYLSSNVLEGFVEAEHNGASVLNSYSVLVEEFINHGDIDLSLFFAKPEITRKNGVAPTSVSWYTKYNGNIHRWKELDYDSQARVGGQVSTLLSKLRRHLEISEYAGALWRWLNVPGLADNLCIIGGHPVLVNWGMTTREAAEAVPARLLLYNQGLGRLADWMPLPPFHSSDIIPSLEAIDGESAPASAGDVIEAASRPAKEMNEPAALLSAAASRAPSAAAVPRVSVFRFQCWLPWAIACAVAALILLFLLLPGVLVYPGLSRASVIDNTQVEAVLRRRIADLQAATGDRSCLASSDASGPLGLVVPTPDGKAPAVYPRTGPPTASGDQPTQLAPAPQQVATASGTLMDLLDSGAALVVLKDGFGSGFFVNETDLVTNRHVVADMAPNDEVHVVNRVLGRPVTGKVVAETAAAEDGSADFAVIRIAAGITHGILPLSSVPARASNVLAYGYPGFVMETDRDFQCLIEGELNCVPLGTVMQGVVAALQTAPDGNPLVVHSAIISEGNSGGPLADYCGRVVGVNTFGRRDQDKLLQLNFAQGAAGLEAFLKSSNIAFSATDDACRLEVNAPPQVQEPSSAAPRL